jgi:hypothetical protein
MKAKSLVLFASAALPFAAAFGQNNAEPTGPQGTLGYGNSAPGVSVPDRNRDRVNSTDGYRARDRRSDPGAPMYGASPSGGASVSPQYDRDTDRSVRQRARNRYDGPSWETNPPVPAQ